MLYPKNNSPELSQELFESPTCEYRGAPFWAWNCKLDRDELLRQLDVMNEMGFGGVHIHVRSGMDTTYLSDEFMDLVRSCSDKTEKDHMLTWLYDEDRWPSGFAGGYVTKDPQYRIRYLLFTPFPYEEVGANTVIGNETAAARRSGLGKLLCRFDVVLDENGCLADYRILPDGEEARGRIWYAYIESPRPSPRHNGQTYVDTLNKKAIERFVEITHEAYKRSVGDKFGKNIPAIFTDEPQFTHKSTLRFPDSLMDVSLPWTDDLEQTFRAAYGVPLTEHIPELIWELPGDAVSLTRYHYHDHICERFASAFADTIGTWCDKNGIMLTGHMMQEPTLESQTSALGEAMRSYRSFQLPGIDMLADRYELTTAKQAQSASRQYGRPGVLSELYGVTTWDFDFRGHKLHGDWQAALGVTVRVPHLAWVSMLGEAKRDYPASISYQSPWYREYPLIENHFARVNTAMTRGKADVRVGVIHPVESYWLHWGPSAQTALTRSQMDENFQNITSWLLYGSIDFDFISESLLPGLCPSGSAPLKVGEMAYDVIILPACQTIRKSTYERLLAFKRAGGKLIVMGSAPTLMDAVPSPLPATLADSILPFSRAAILGALADERAVEIRNADGNMTTNLLHQLRTDGENKWLFLVNGKHPTNKDISRRQNIVLRIRGHYVPTLYDTLTGEIREIPYRYDKDSTVIERTIYSYDSLLLHLVPGEVAYVAPEKAASDRKPVSLHVPFKVAYTRSEPNALLLDQAQYALDDEEYGDIEELLRADTALRNRMGWTPWNGSSNQPWCMEKVAPTHKVRLRFRFESEIPVKGASLALETPLDAKITFNGQEIDNRPNGYYVDKAIECVRLPEIPAGVSTLEIVYPFGERTAIEWCYILGDFGVKVEGRVAKIVPEQKLIGFGSVTDQGMPFYSGALTYHMEAQTSGGDLEITVPQYHGAVIRAFVDDQSQIIAFNPYKARFTSLAPGKHAVGLKLYINRTNGFNALHNADRKLSYQSPSAWRSSGDSWCYEYRLIEQGILSSPWFTEV